MRKKRLSCFVWVLCLFVVCGKQSEASLPDGHKLDWYQWADVKTSPYMINLWHLADGDLKTMGHYAHGPCVGGALEFIFPDIVRVTAVRLLQSGDNAAAAFEVTVKKEGADNYEDSAGVHVVDDTELDRWVTIPVDKKAMSLKIRASNGPADHRSVYPAYRQVEIYTDQEISVPSVKPEMFDNHVDKGDEQEMPEFETQAYDAGSVARVMRGNRDRNNRISEGCDITERRRADMLQLLVKWGLDRSSVPAETCLLLSKASEEMWRNKERPARLMENIAASDASEQTSVALEIDRYRGSHSAVSMESLLSGKGIQYDVLYTDNEETLGDLGKYKLIILPFSYSMTEHVYELLKSAVEDGAGLLILDQQAPADEYGNRRTKPMLADLLGHPGVTYVDKVPAHVGTMRSFRKKCARIIRDKLVDSAYYFNNPDIGESVEYIARETDDGKRILYLANRDKDAEKMPMLGLKLPENCKYSIKIYSSHDGKLYEGRMLCVDIYGFVLRRTTIIYPIQLLRFSLSIAPDEKLLLLISPES